MNRPRFSLCGNLLPRFSALLLFGCALCLPLDVEAEAHSAESGRAPNIIVIMADDMGYGDLGCYGHPTIKTPHLDQMAREGMRFTSWYAAAEVCTPSRAGLLTGRLPPRSGVCSNKRRVLFPNSQGGIPAAEVTIAELLKGQGYATGCVGKWHLGHRPEFLPTRNGFDSFFGLPYSNDMDRTAAAPKGWQAFRHPEIPFWNVPLMRDESIIERPAEQTTLTRRYTEEAIAFIRKHRDGPFLLYMPHTFPHIPLFASDKFAGQSRRGMYGDAVEEIDWSVGQVLAALRAEQLEKNTLVFFTSDNGPWLTQAEQGGSAGLLKDGKGSTYEGGMREPGIAWWPGKIAAGTTSDEVVSSMDIYATAAALSGAPLPQDRELDCYDLTPILTGDGTARLAREAYFYYRGFELMAVRMGPWKAHYFTQIGYGQAKPDKHDPPVLYNLDIDPSERFNVAKDHADILAKINDLTEKHRAKMTFAKSQLE